MGKIKRLIAKIVVVSLILFLIGSVILFKASQWFNAHEIEFKPPVEFTFNKIVTIKDREMLTPVVNIISQLPTLENLTSIEEYICEKWGVYDCRVALAVAKAESGMREQAFNINTNNTIDIGIYQINSVHFEKEGCSLKDLVDEYKNVDCAYGIWEQQGWNPWVAFTNGNFKSNL